MSPALQDLFTHASLHRSAVACPCRLRELPASALQDLATNATSHTLLDAYEYVMHGKIFKTQDAKVHGQMKLDVFISFGGLLMKLTGAAKELELLQPDNDVFLLMRRVRD